MQGDASPPPQGRSSVAGLVIVGALLGFGGLLFLANFSGQVADPDRPRSGGDPFATGKAKIAKKVKAGKQAKVPEEKLLVAGGPIERAKAPEGAKNVLVVITTAVRRDAVTPYGADPNATPFLADLASKGARFTDVISAGPFSRTAATALLTGQHAAPLDMVDPGPGPEFKVLKPEVETLAERLRAAGWTTLGVTANFNLNTNSGLAQGFDRYRDAQPSGFAPGLRLEGPGVVKQALALLEQRTEEEKARPFYLQVDLIDAHQPIRVVADQLEDFGGKEDKLAPYKAAVHRVDGFVRDLVSGLDALGHVPGQDLYVVVVSDHGEGNDDPPHHGKQHGRLLYDSAVAVPWIVAGPDVPPNRLVQGLASGTDFMPTVLGLAGVPAPDAIDGRSWADAVRGTAERTTRETAISDTWYFTANRSSIWTERMQCQKDFGTTDLADAFADGCFDRKTDATFKNLLQDEALMAELVRWRTEVTKAVTASAPRPAGAPGDDPAEGDAAAPAEGEEAG